MRPSLVLGTSSDHAGLYLQLTQLEKGSKPFKFYNSWLRGDEFNTKFKKAWATTIVGTPLYKLQQKINAARQAGKEWARKKRLAAELSRTVVAELQTVATKLQGDPLNPTIQNAFRELKSKLIEVQHREQLDFQQRAHVNWITKGE